MIIHANQNARNVITIKRDNFGPSNSASLLILQVVIQ